MKFNQVSPAIDVTSFSRSVNRIRVKTEPSASSWTTRISATASRTSMATTANTNTTIAFCHLFQSKNIFFREWCKNKMRETNDKFIQE